MKMAVAGLVLLGLVAALAAAVLIASMNANGGLAKRAAVLDDSEVTVLLATKALPPMSVLDANCVITKSMPHSKAPAGFLSSPVEVVGKVLAVPVVEGQAFTKGVFSEDAGTHIAAALPHGKRAVGISVTEYGGLEGLLYPGSVVDVLVSLKPNNNFGDIVSNVSTSRSPPQTGVTRTLLQGVEVLAIDQHTVTSPEQVVGATKYNNSRRVTLLVDPKQAKLLELAMDQGTLSLALRNPLDQATSDTSLVSLYDLFPESSSSSSRTSEFVASALKSLGTMMASRMQSQKVEHIEAPPAPPPPAPKWDVMVIQGDKAESHSFELPKTSQK